MQVLRSTTWEYSRKKYVVTDNTHMKTADGWVPAVIYVPVIPVPGSPNHYCRRTDDFLKKFRLVVHFNNEEE